MTFRALAFAGAAILAAGPALAQSDAERFAPIQGNDAFLSCEQLQQEAGVMEQTLGAAPGGTFNVDQALGVGASLAQQAGAGGVARALGGFGGGIGGALGGLARQAAQQQQETDGARKEMAQDRWYYLAGLYMGRSCNQPQAAVPPAPLPVSAPIPAAPVPAQPMAGPVPPAPAQ